MSNTARAKHLFTLSANYDFSSLQAPADKYAYKANEEGVTPVEVIKPGKGKEENEAKLN